MMTLTDFVQQIREHPDLEEGGYRLAGQSEPGAVVSQGHILDRDTVYLCHTPTNTMFALGVSQIVQSEWGELEGVFTGRREARVLTYLTRIVGYYSPTYAWNRSKLAELRDRGRGDYAVPAPEDLPADIGKPREAITT